VSLFEIRLFVVMFHACASGMCVCVVLCGCVSVCGCVSGCVCAVCMCAVDCIRVFLVVRVCVDSL